MNTTIALLNELKQHSNKDLLHAYTSYLVIMVDAVTFAMNPYQKPTHIHHRCGFCHVALKLGVDSRITGLLVNLHTQTGCSIYPVAGGVYSSWKPFEKWEGEYGKQRRLFISDCIETLRLELNSRGYKF